MSKPFCFLKILILVLFCVKSNCTVNAQIPNNRLVDWSKAGLQSPIASIQIINMASYGIDNTGVLPADSILANVISNAVPPVEIKFDAGIFLFTKPIKMRSGIILSGQGANTKLIADLITPDDFIKIEGKLDTSKIYLTQDAQLNSNTIATTSTLELDSYYLLSFNDSNLMFSSWAYGSAGQIYKIQKSLSTGTFEYEVDSKHRLDYTVAKSAYLRKINAIKDVAIKCLSIETKTNVVDQLRNINIKYAINCEVKGVQSFNCNFAHAAIEASKYNSISGCYFHHAFDYGGGGNGYGAVVHFAACDNLIENNIFEHLRHSMLLQAGANGNVFAYNFSTDPYWENVVPNSAGDIAIHGNYPYCNLIEGNVISHLWSDNSHGANGKFNTAVRNRIYGYGFSITSGDSMNIASNEIINYTPLFGNWNIGTSVGHFMQGNNIVNADNITYSIQPTAVLDTTKSYYTSTKPSYLWSATNWPLIGLPNAPNYATPTATNRFTDGTLVQCNDVSLALTEIPTQKINLFPNPCNGNFVLEGAAIGEQFLIFDTYGRLLKRITNDFKNQQHRVGLSAGIYLVKGTSSCAHLMVE
jgi:hypothetical protein